MGVKASTARTATASTAMEVARRVQFLRKKLAERKGVANPPRPKKRLTMLSTMARCSDAAAPASALAPVTTMPPPAPSKNSSNAMEIKPPARGSANSAMAMAARPSSRPILSPRASSSGPMESEATMRPTPCAAAMRPFCRGVSWKRSERRGRMVPNRAEVMP